MQIQKEKKNDAHAEAISIRSSFSHLETKT